MSASLDVYIRMSIPVYIYLAIKQLYYLELNEIDNQADPIPAPDVPTLTSDLLSADPAPAFDDDNISEISVDISVDF